MLEVLIVAGCLIGYVAVSGEVLAYFRGPHAVPRLARIGLQGVRSGTGWTRVVRGAIGVVFVATLLLAMVIIVLNPSEARTSAVTLALWTELGAASLWTVFVLIRVARAST